MDNSRTIEQQHKIDEYNAVPIVYCADCLSLRIQAVDGIDYCDKCGSTSIKEANIHDWEDMYISKYGDKYLNIEINGKKARP